MFDFVHKRKRIVQVIMVIAVLPFLFWGLESYQNSDDDYVAIISGEKIYRQEFDQALRNRFDAMRGSMGDSFNASILDDPKIRISVLEDLIQKRLLNIEADRLRITVSDSQLVDALQGIPVFKQDGKFSNQLYRELLRNKGLDVVKFESNIRQNMMRQQVVDGYLKNGFISNTVVKNIISLSEEKREINSIQIQPSGFLSKIKPNDNEIKEYYSNHQDEFKRPEEIKVEYLVLSLDNLAEEIVINSNETHKYFEENKADFGEVEQRQASHILFSAPDTSSDEDRASALSKAEELLVQIKQAPHKFAEFAKEHSQDAGSADKGGDLGFFSRNMMDKDFEDEIFQMKPGEIRGPIKTGFGFHIIKLSAIKDGKSINFDEVKDEVEKRIRRQKVSKNFGDKAEEFRNLVYEEGDNYRLAAETLKLPIKKSGWINKAGGKEQYLNDTRLLQVMFSEDSIENKQNSEVIEINQDNLISARVIEYRPAIVLSMTEVREKIIGILARKMASDQAVKDGTEKLAQLQRGEKNIVTWESSNMTVSRNDPKGLEEEVMRAIFKVKPFSFPAYTGIINSQGGFSLIRINNVIDAVSPDEEKINTFSRQLQQLYSQEEFLSYLSAIKQRADVTVIKGRIESQ
tara:strand:- start:5125 stop:7014 length:1890 start_codon:yes stop_codon:yes gene_type:complete